MAERQRGNLDFGMEGGLLVGAVCAGVKGGCVRASPLSGLLTCCAEGCPRKHIHFSAIGVHNAKVYQELLSVRDMGTLVRCWV